MLGSDIMHDAHTKSERRRRVTGPDHQCVPGGLDLMGLMLDQQSAHGRAEPADEIGGLVVSVCLGQRG